MRRTMSLIALTGLIAVTSALGQETPPPAPPPAAPLATPPAHMVESIKIILEDKAKSDGELRLDFTPAGGATKAIRVTIAKKMSNKAVAEDLAKELKVALGADWKVDRYDADKIKISSKKDVKFALTLSSMTASGLSVRLK